MNNYGQRLRHELERVKPGGAVWINLAPVEMDANAAAAVFARRRGYAGIDDLIAAAGRSAGLFAFVPAGTRGRCPRGWSVSDPCPRSVRDLGPQSNGHELLRPAGQRTATGCADMARAPQRLTTERAYGSGPLAPVLDDVCDVVARDEHIAAAGLERRVRLAVAGLVLPEQTPRLPGVDRDHELRSPGEDNLRCHCPGSYRDVSDNFRAKLRTRALVTTEPAWRAGSRGTFVSSKDLTAGGRWQNEIAAEPEATNFGIICVTSDYQLSPWLNLEAGALAKAVTASRVVPHAIDLRPSETRFRSDSFRPRRRRAKGSAQ